MAHDDEFIIGGQKSKKSSSSQGMPRTTNPRGGSQSAIKLGKLSGGSMSFTKRLSKDMAIAKRSSGRRTYAKPSKPKTGRFNARDRGRKALAAGIAPTVVGSRSMGAVSVIGRVELSSMSGSW